MVNKMENDGEPINFRYDVVSIVANPELTRKDVPIIRDDIMSSCEGDCLVMANMKGMVKVHFHTNEPEKLFEVLAKYGTLETKEVEDMKEQYDAFMAKKDSERD